MTDKYKSFAELCRYERHGTDFRLTMHSDRGSTLIIAPHGGKIEPGTSEIATLIASNIHNLYLFEGAKSTNNRDLHITSSNFDDPNCIELAAKAKYIVAVHGCIGGTQKVFIGGLDKVLGQSISRNLNHSGFITEVHPNPSLQGHHRNNICNRSMRGQGAQLEITRGLRDALCSDANLARIFAEAVQTGIQEIINL